MAEMIARHTADRETGLEAPFPDEIANLLGNAPFFRRVLARQELRLT